MYFNSTRISQMPRTAQGHLGLRLVLALAFTLSGMSLVSSGAWSQVPHDMTYQGQLTDAVGAPLSGSVNLQLRIFEVLSGGSTLYAEDHSGVTLDTDGAFSVQLGAGAATTGTFNVALFSGVNRYLEVVVDGEVLTPRQVLASVPWALVAEEAQSLAGNATLVTDVESLEAQLGSAGPGDPPVVDQLSSQAGSIAANTVAATAAHGTANTALTNAATAQGTANTAVTHAAAAQSAADGAVTDAAAAQGTANTNSDGLANLVLDVGANTGDIGTLQATVASGSPDSVSWYRYHAPASHGAVPLGTQICIDSTNGAERWDNDNLHDMGTNPCRATINTEGIYLISINSFFNRTTSTTSPGASSGRHELSFWRNGNREHGETVRHWDEWVGPAVGGSVYHYSSSRQMRFTAGQYLEVKVEWVGNGTVHHYTEAVSITWIAPL